MLEYNNDTVYLEQWHFQNYRLLQAKMNQVCFRNLFEVKMNQV